MKRRHEGKNEGEGIKERSPEKWINRVNESLGESCEGTKCAKSGRMEQENMEILLPLLLP